MNTTAARNFAAAHQHVPGLARVAASLDATTDPAAALDALDDALDALPVASDRAALLGVLALLTPRADRWRDHVGEACPTAPDALIAVDLGDLDEPHGRVRVDRASAWCWGPGAGPAGEGRIQRWAPITAD